MKKILAILLAFVMMFGMAACGGSDTEEDSAAEMKVGVIYIGSINDGGYTQAQHAGTVAMQEYFGASKEIPVTDFPVAFLPTWTSFNSLLRFVV